MDLRPKRAGRRTRAPPDGCLLYTSVYLLFCTSRRGWGWKQFLAEADAGEGLKFPKWSRAYVTYVLPFIVLVIFAMGYYQKFFQ